MQIIAEGANGPTTVEADKIFLKKNILVIPVSCWLPFVYTYHVHKHACTILKSLLYIHKHTYTHAYTHMHTYKLAYTHINTLRWLFAYIYTRMYAYKGMTTCIAIHECTRLQTHICTLSDTHTTHTFACMHAHMDTCMHMYSSTSFFLLPLS